MRWSFIIHLTCSSKLTLPKKSKSVPNLCAPQSRADVVVFSFSFRTLAYSVCCRHVRSLYTRHRGRNISGVVWWGKISPRAPNTERRQMFQNKIVSADYKKKLVSPWLNNLCLHKTEQMIRLNGRRHDGVRNQVYIKNY